MKALEKECARRYPSASEMAADIQRHLCDAPVTAGPAGTVYRFRKFLRKNALYVTAVATITGFLVACLVVSTAYFIRAQRMGDFVLRASYGANIAAASSDLEHGDLAQAGRRLDLWPR